jgi:hypothetical protein
MFLVTAALLYAMLLCMRRALWVPVVLDACISAFRHRRPCRLSND